MTVSRRNFLEVWDHGACRRAYQSEPRTAVNRSLRSGLSRRSSLTCSAQLSTGAHQSRLKWNSWQSERV